MGGGLLRTNNQQERKTKKLLGILGIGLVIGVVNVRAITSHEVTYDNQGVTENLTETLDKLYRELKEYKTSGSVTSTEMLEGSTGYAKGKLVTGSIKRKEAQTYIPGTTDQTISSGQYLNGDQIVKGDVHLVASNIKSGISLFGVTGTFTSDANAIANQILSGKTAYVKGNKITGSMSNKAGATVTASTTTSDATYTYVTIPAAGYYDTSSKVKVENNKLSGNYDKVMYSSNAGNGTSVNVTLTIPSNVDKGIIMFTDNYYTGIGATPTFTIPTGVSYENIMSPTVLSNLTGYSTNYMYVQIISARNIANKTFSLTTNVGYNRGYIWLFY